MMPSKREHLSIITKVVRIKDADRFDQLSRMRAGLSRRRFGRVLTVLGLVWGIGALTGDDETAAKAKKKKKRKKISYLGSKIICEFFKIS